MQGSAGVQEPPGAHATHAPAVQTMFVPHLVPSGALPASVQTGEDVVHAIDPILHTAARGHVAPALQAMQPPLPLQTLSSWHGCPAGTLPDSTQVHVGPRSAQTTVPVLQPPGGKHALPFAKQAPPPSSAFSARWPASSPGSGIVEATEVTVRSSSFPASAVGMST
jgi:hypothetical protein